ncbi:uncharacterized protein [Fopius arisanus]|uniref:Uncharacterized protein isoform X3 n=1 Tax=Fopius arisanus TaxID=64838 RepID=A0A9R1TXE0_9HYME|nr:PREDICTED: uncharacterized protein LOC105264707 isoform X3 [Fopius arisanus]
MSSFYLNIFTLRMLGFWFPDETSATWRTNLYRIYNAFAVTAMCGFVLSQFFAALSCLHDTKELTNASFLLVTIIAVAGKMFNLTIYQYKIRRMVGLFDLQPFKSLDDNEVLIKSKFHRSVKRFIFVYATMSIVTCTLITIFSLIRDMPRRQLLFKARYPFDDSTAIGYWISYMHQHYSHYLGAIFNTFFDTFIGALMLDTSAQLEILKYRLIMMPSAMENERSQSGCKGSPEEVQKIESKHLENHTNHHLAILEILKNDQRNIHCLNFSPILREYSSSLHQCLHHDEPEAFQQRVQLSADVRQLARTCRRVSTGWIGRVYQSPARKVLCSSWLVL